MNTQRLNKEILRLASDVVEEANGYKVSLDVDDGLIIDGILDSLSMIKLVHAIQLIFDIEITLFEINEQNFDSVQSIAALVMEKSNFKISEVI